MQQMCIRDSLGPVHYHQTHGLTVGPAGGKPEGLDDILHHVLRHRFLLKAAVGAAGSKKLHDRHKKSLVSLKIS